ncbi:DUF6338 family protein [Actinotalea sp. C106]|uniref:DUF6338 family protein n=1 Tax=Actinotalea sp. C106 TaxID=2908644 RepID=UPI002028D6F9|nr:DUF6338 family protein [Actinotalea sp. C106]
MFPTTWLQVAVILAAVIPGFVHQLSRRALTGPAPDEATVSVRVLRSIAISAVYATVYAFFLGPWAVDLSQKTPAEVAEQVRTIAFMTLATALVIPWAVAWVMFRVGTSSNAQKFRKRTLDRTEHILEHRVGGRLHGWVNLRSTYDPTPTAWDFAFVATAIGWVRVLTKDGQWIGGFYGPESHATTYPEPRQLFIQVGQEMKADGTFGSEVSAPGGLWVNCEDAVLVDFTPETGETRSEREEGTDASI